MSLEGEDLPVWHGRQTLRKQLDSTHKQRRQSGYTATDVTELCSQFQTSSKGVPHKTLAQDLHYPDPGGPKSSSWELEYSLPVIEKRSQPHMLRTPQRKAILHVMTSFGTRAGHIITDLWNEISGNGDTINGQT